METQDKNKEVTISETSLPGVFKIERPVFPDNRGFLHEIVRMNELERMSGVDFRAVQISHLRSQPRVIRAIHTEDWNKVVYPVTGKLFVALVDVRPESASFGKYETFTFDSEADGSKHTALFVPAGIGNSLCAIGDKPVDYIYAVDEYWDNSKAQGIAWDDPDLNIPWPVKDPIISERDRQNPKIRELFPEKFR